MLVYVVFGGMVATTWVQIVKASLLMLAVTAMALLVLARFGFDPEHILTAAVAKRGLKILQPGSLVTGQGAAISLALSLMFGPAGLPHLLMRFFTVPNVAEARKSAFVATLLIGVFTLLIEIEIIGYGAVALLSGDPLYIAAGGGLKGGGNMAGCPSPRSCARRRHVAGLRRGRHLRDHPGGGIWNNAYGRRHRLPRSLWTRHAPGAQTERQELRVSRLAALVFGAICVALSALFKDQNVTFLSAFAFSVAASATFPLLGAVALLGEADDSGRAGRECPAWSRRCRCWRWGRRSGSPSPTTSSRSSPTSIRTIISMPLAFVVAITVSLMTRAPAPARQADRA